MAELVLGIKAGVRLRWELSSNFTAAVCVLAWGSKCLSCPFSVYCHQYTSHTWKNTVMKSQALLCLPWGKVKAFFVTRTWGRKKTLLKYPWFGYGLHGHKFVFSYLCRAGFMSHVFPSLPGSGT